MQHEFMQLRASRECVFAWRASFWLRNLLSRRAIRGDWRCLADYEIVRATDMDSIRT
jgi:hypothetical protein|tara:strand:- start:1651 stop:1821 length:171 start_codon:yes stop_codon:yes gene_type:complete